MNGCIWKWLGENEESRSKRIQIFVIYITVFVDVIGYGLVLALLPFLAMKYGANGLLLGVVFSSYSLCNFIASLVLGRLSDRYGRKPIIMISLFGSMIGPLLLFLSDSVLWLVLSRSIAGFCGGSVPVAQAYVSDITSKEDRMQYMGWLGSFVSLGIVAGPAIGGLLSGFGLKWPVLAASIIAGFNIVIAWFILKETYHNKTSTTEIPTLEEPASPTLLQKIMESFRILGSKEYIFFFTSSFLSSCGMSALEIGMPFSMQQRFGASASTLGWMWTVYGVGLVVIKTFMVPPAKKYLGEKKSALVAQLGVGVFVICLALAPNLILAFIAFACHASFQGLFSPSLPSLLSMRSPDNLRGLLLGSYASSGQLAKIFLPLVTGLLLNVNVRLPFFAAAGTHLMTVGSIILIKGESPSRYQVLPLTTDEEAPEESAEMSEMSVVTSVEENQEDLQAENEDTKELLNQQVNEK